MSEYAACNEAQFRMPRNGETEKLASGIDDEDKYAPWAQKNEVLVYLAILHVVNIAVLLVLRPGQSQSHPTSIEDGVQAISCMCKRQGQSLQQAETWAAKAGGTAYLLQVL